MRARRPRTAPAPGCPPTTSPPPGWRTSRTSSASKPPFAPPARRRRRSRAPSIRRGCRRDLRGGPRETRAVLSILGGVIEELESLGDGLDDDERRLRVRRRAIRRGAIRGGHPRGRRASRRATAAHVLANRRAGQGGHLGGRDTPLSRPGDARGGGVDAASSSARSRRVGSTRTRSGGARAAAASAEKSDVRAGRPDGKPRGEPVRREEGKSGRTRRARFKTLKDARAASRVRKNLDYHIAKLRRRFRDCRRRQTRSSRTWRRSSPRRKRRGRARPARMAPARRRGDATTHGGARGEARETARESFAPSGMSVKKPSRWRRPSRTREDGRPKVRSPPNTRHARRARW